MSSRVVVTLRAVLCVLALLAPLAASRAEAETIRGIARVIDGDTIRIGDHRIRLEGIDAPENGQTCTLAAGGGKWNCGASATLALERMIAGHEVVCETRGKDKYRRDLATCFVESVDINRELVRAGLAWAFLRYSRTYEEEEAVARRRQVGIWQAPTDPAWDYRARAWAVAEPEAPQGCAIKGNITRQGRIYHMPWSPWYEKISMDESKGKRWFCSEDEAVAAGWRPVYAR